MLLLRKLVIQKQFNYSMTCLRPLGQNGVLRYGHFGEFLEFFWDRIANLGLIDFKLGLYIKVDVNTWAKQVSSPYIKNLAKMTINWHKIGQLPLWRARFPWS